MLSAERLCELELQTSFRILRSISGAAQGQDQKLEWNSIAEVFETQLAFGPITIQPLENLSSLGKANFDIANLYKRLALSEEDVEQWVKDRSGIGENSQDEAQLDRRFRVKSILKALDIAIELGLSDLESIEKVMELHRLRLDLENKRAVLTLLNLLDDFDSKILLHHVALPTGYIINYT